MEHARDHPDIKSNIGLCQFLQLFFNLPVKLPNWGVEQRMPYRAVGSGTADAVSGGGEWNSGCRIGRWGVGTREYCIAMAVTRQAFPVKFL